MALATDLYDLLKDGIDRIDLSHINESSLGKREIVVVLKLPNDTRHILRLSTKSYKEELLDYQSLKSTIEAGDFIVDLRVPELAYITQLKDKLLQ